MGSFYISHLGLYCIELGIFDGSDYVLPINYIYLPNVCGFL